MGGSGNIVHRAPNKNKNHLSANRNTPIKASVSSGTIVQGEKTVPVCPVTQLGQTHVPSSASILFAKSFMTNKSYQAHNSTRTKLFTLLCRSSRIRWYFLLQCPAQTKGCVALHFSALIYSIELLLAQSNFQLVHRLWCRPNNTKIIYSLPCRSLFVKSCNGQVRMKYIRCSYNVCFLVHDEANQFFSSWKPFYLADRGLWYVPRENSGEGAELWMGLFFWLGENQTTWKSAANS